MRKLLFSAAVLTALTACSSKNDPNEKNFGAAIDAYLAKKGDLCLNTETWPVDVTEMDRKMSASRGIPGKLERMNALVSVGLATSSDVDKPQVSFTGQPTGRSVRLTQYSLTSKGREFFRERQGTFSKPKEGEMRGDICYGRRAVDSIIKWEGPVKLGDYQDARVKYHYKIVDLADWAKAPEIQSAFPSIKDLIDGAGNKQQSHAVHLTSVGWEAKGID
jgi:hypothetical protein